MDNDVEASRQEKPLILPAIEPLKPREIAYSGDWQFSYNYARYIDDHIEWFQREDVGYDSEDEDWELPALIPQRSLLGLQNGSKRTSNKAEKREREREGGMAAIDFIRAS